MAKIVNGEVVSDGTPVSESFKRFLGDAKMAELENRIQNLENKMKLVLDSVEIIYFEGE